MEVLSCTVDDACIAIGVKKTTLYSLIAAKKLRAIKIGRRTLIKTDSIREFVESCEAA